MSTLRTATFIATLAFVCVSAFAQDAELGLKEGFANPPAGYGEVPFWWWTGEKLDVERLNWQLDELKKKGISGVQVNYAHQDVTSAAQPNWLTYPNEPEVMTDEWFDAFSKVAEHCRELDMGVGLSGYTLDWQRSPNNLFDRLIYQDKELQSLTLHVEGRRRVAAGGRYSSAVTASELVSDETDSLVKIVAYPIDESNVIDVENFVVLDESSLENAAPTDCEIWIYRAKREPCTLNPLHPESGRVVVERFFAPFETRAIAALGGKDDGKSTLGLEYFFQDELQLGTGETIWTADAAREFETRKGYSYWIAAPAMFGAKVGRKTEKYRLDYMDVRVKLAEERYFMPIYAWNANRGRIYACDPGSRGKDPYEFCDYFSAIRWYTAPGHDTPGGHADFIKNKVSSSIAHFYQRPRVWLEGYHSFGWGAEPKQLFFATNENFLFGANLLNLHGLYYTTYGGYWEWAPPCYHFRQPYWETFGAFLKYFERLSFALTRGVEQTDFVVLYPVSAYQSGLNGARARDVAFEAATRIFGSGRDVLFIDDESIARAEVRDGKLCVAGGEHRVLVLPSTQGIRQSTLDKALELYRAGGTVVALDALPLASDRAGRDDPEFTAIVREIFGCDASERIDSSTTKNSHGGIGAFYSPIVLSSAASNEGDKIGSEGAVSKLRRYDERFVGRWVWSVEQKQEVTFKWIANGLTDESRDYSARFFCDNAGSLYVNGEKICDSVDYSSGWRGILSLRNGDVVTIDGRDADVPRRGSAGMFFALADEEGSIATAEDFRYSLEEIDADWRKRSDDFVDLLPVDVGNVHVLHRTGVNTELAGVSAPSNDGKQDDSQMWRNFESLLARYSREVFDADSGASCSVMKRTTDECDIYFVMKGKKGARLAFRSQGKAEFYNMWDGSSREPAFVVLPEEGDASGTTVVTWPYNEDEAGLIVFWKNEKPSLAFKKVESDCSEIESVNVDSQGKWTAQVYDESGEAKVSLTTLSGEICELTGTSKKASEKLALDGDWEFQLLPTLDNRWGDFRLPISEPVVGPEAQRLDFFGLGEYGVDFGRKLMEIGPFPNDVDLSELEARLANSTFADQGRPVEFMGKSYSWRPYSFSWRWGIEGNPGHEGYHGLKEKIDSRFIGLGVQKDAHNETVFAAEEGGSVYYLWSTLPVVIEDVDEGRANVDVYVSGGAPSAIYVDGKRFENGKRALRTPNEKIENKPVLLKYESAGRYACCFVRREESSASSQIVELNGLDSGAFNGLSTGLREETPEWLKEERVPLSTIWFNAPGVLNYDILGATPGCTEEDSQIDSVRLSNVQRASFIAPPGLKKIYAASYGKIHSLSIDGFTPKLIKTETLISGQDFWRGARSTDASCDLAPSEGLGALKDDAVYWTVFELEKAVERESKVDVLVGAGRGRRDGALFPEPIRLSCETGATTLGDWNTRGVLENYSGGARYSHAFYWNRPKPKNGRVTLDLGSVGVSSRVYVNGKLAADIPTPPWTLDITKYVQSGENRVDVETYSALANFYKNIPSRYKGTVPSGLIGPVEIRFEPSIELK